MRQNRNAQISIFETYSKHEFGAQLRRLSGILDQHPEILPLVAKDLRDDGVSDVGCRGLSAESVLRCLLLKQLLQVSYERLAFFLSDSRSYSSFARLAQGRTPSRSSLQSTIRRIRPQTLEQIHHLLTAQWIADKSISLNRLRIDSTVVSSPVAPPSDSQLLSDGIRVLSRGLSKSKMVTGEKIRFTDQRKPSKSLAFQIFNAKSAEKEALYPQLLRRARCVVDQADRALVQVTLKATQSPSTVQWIKQIEHYRALMIKVIDQTTRRVINKEQVHSSEKIVSIFEPHTDIIVKGFRDVQYGHKINLSTQCEGFITSVSIQSGNPNDSELYMPTLRDHQKRYGCVAQSVVADGSYASKDNVKSARALGVQHAVFHKRAGLSYNDMGVKEKTFVRLRRFRSGIEGNISELKRVFGAGRATWKGLEGFKAFVWSSVISYNLVRLARISPG